MTWDEQTINGPSVSDARHSSCAASTVSRRLQNLRPRSLVLKMGRKSKKISGESALRRRISTTSSFQHFRRTSCYRKPVRRPGSPVAKFALAVNGGTAPIASTLRDTAEERNVYTEESDCAATQKLAKSHNKKATSRLTVRYKCKKKRAQKQIHYKQWRRPRKVVVIGDMCSGKSGLISAYCKDRFSETYIPTFLHTCLTDAKVFGETIELVVVEVSGRDDYARLRQCAYHKMDAVIFCYSADNVTSLDRITETWLPELQKHAPKVPYILVGTKKDVKENYIHQMELISSDGECDRREDLLQSVVTTAQGSELARSIGAHNFVECSARYRDGTREVFETAAKVALQKSRRKRKSQPRTDLCAIL